ncbi:glycosyltransferase family 2 protein [Ruania albidiflava]|uniref:glycosyltransferase family 2 protein n=1 Tax=Ruania albidiflava TaxID=366586 RepID=UPI001FE0F4AA|nr:glycosyltransferase [Ruania albidiflava]
MPTFQRAERLSALLRALPGRVDECVAEHPNVRVDVLVVDNDPAGSARGAVREVDGVLVRYVVEPTPGIAAARNRLLDSSSDSDLLVFIDDDEIPRPGWLSALVRVWRQHRAAAVMGRVISVFDDDVDPWLLASGTFRRPQRPTGTLLTAAATGNLLLDLEQVRAFGVRFDETMGLGGGEDTLFSRQLIERGGRIVWCNESETEDYVATDRLDRVWAKRRAFSSANATTRVELKLVASAGARVKLRVWFALGGVSRIVVGRLRWLLGKITSNLDHDARGARLVHRGRGMAAGAFGYRYDEYRRKVDRY